MIVPKDSIVNALSNISMIVHEDEDKNKNPIGFLVAIKHPTDNKVYIGYSLCHSAEVFNKHLGKEIAVRRAYTRAVEQSHNEILSVPQSMLSAYSYFVKRCEKYFKNCEIK